MVKVQQVTGVSSSEREKSYEWIFTLITGLLCGSALLRTLLVYAGNPILVRLLGLLFAFLVLFLGERLISFHNRRPTSSGQTNVHPPNFFAFYTIYLSLQTLLVCLLIYIPSLPERELFAVLFAALSLQIARNYEPKATAIWISIFMVLMAGAFVPGNELFPGAATTLLYTGANILMASFSLATRRSESASAQNRLLASQITEANRQLQEYTSQAERLAAARERSRLARELHDSVTQTLFSMNLVTQSAGMLLARQPEKVPGQLDRLTTLAQSAQAELQLLISELRSETAGEQGLVESLRRQLAARRLRDSLEVSLVVDGDGSLPIAVEKRLFGIIQEALNNTLKHAQVSTACVHLHLAEPFWVEIDDRGVGFDMAQASTSGGVGLAGMRERAAEIGWELQVNSAPGTGTRIHVAPAVPVERQAE